MYLRFVYSLSASLLVTVLHIGCCLLPLFSVIPVSVMHTGFWEKYQPVFEVLQWGMLMWLTGRLLAFHIFQVPFHSRLERLSYYISLVITISGLIVNYQKPFRTEQQVLAERHFERLRRYRQLTIRFSEHIDQNQLLADLSDIDGVRAGSVKVAIPEVRFSYNKDRVTREQIYRTLLNKGYKFQ